MTIKEASQVTGISIDNLRYYERIGVIPPIERTKSGIRDYDETALQWISFVLKFKQAGASLEAIIEYVQLAGSDHDSKEARRTILLEIQEDLMQQIEKLNGCLEMIDYKVKTFDHLCDPVTQEMIEKWKEKNEKER